jgi:hypothetical protein
LGERKKKKKEGKKSVVCSAKGFASFFQIRFYFFNPKTVKKFISKSEPTVHSLFQKKKKNFFSFLLSLSLCLIFFSIVCNILWQNMTESNILTQEQLSNLKLYKYASVDKSFLSRYVLRHYWDWAIEYFPINMA